MHSRQCCRHSTHLEHQQLVSSIASASSVVNCSKVKILCSIDEG